MQRLKIVVAGAGSIGRTHIALIRQAPECRLHAIVDPSPATQAFAAEMDVPQFQSLSDLLDGERPDGVIIATPNAIHAENAIACLQRRIPVLIEKPIADTLENAERIIAAAERNETAVLVGHHRRHNPIIQRARDVVAGGKLSRIATAAAFTIFLKPDAYFDVAWRREPGGGPVLTNLIHTIDDLRFMCGEIVNLSAMTSNVLRGFPVEDSAVVTLQFASGALGALTASDSGAAPWSWELTSGENPEYPNEPEDCYFIAGTHRSIAVPSLRPWSYAQGRGWNEPLGREDLKVERANPLARQLSHFCAVIRGAAQPLVDARDAARTLAATVGIHAAAQRRETLRL